jgi:hypothetical protein
LKKEGYVSFGFLHALRLTRTPTTAPIAVTANMMTMYAGGISGTEGEGVGEFCVTVTCLFKGRRAVAVAVQSHRLKRGFWTVVLVNCDLFYDGEVMFREVHNGC